MNALLMLFLMLLTASFHFKIIETLQTPRNKGYNLMSRLCKTNNHKLRNTLCLPIQHRLDKDLKSDEEYGCTVQQQQESPNKNRTFIISDPQHCSVSATLSLGRPKKLFISKGSRAAATFQAATTITAQRQNLNNSKEISTSHSRIDQKPPLANFETRATSPSSNEHTRDSVNSNNDSISLLLQQNYPKTVPSDPIPVDSAETASVPKCSDTVTPEITIDIPHPDSSQSTLNSRGSGGYRGDCSSVNSLHSTEHKDGMNRRQNNINEFRESLSSRLSRGFLEFTQGSSDRLQKWKNKLQNGRRHKDSSEPPPANRKMPTTNQEQNGHLSDVEVVLDWAALKCDSTDQIHNAKFSPKRSVFAQKEDRSNLPTRSTSDFFLTSESTTSRTTLNGSGTIMDQQNLKQRDNKGPRTVKNLAAHFQNLKNIRTTTAQTVENCDNLSNNLPPPVRITPYSGVKPKDMDIIRPVAFRPYASRKSDKRQTVISSSFSFYNSDKKSDYLTKRLSNNDELKRSSQHSKDTVSNSSAPSSGYGSTRPRAIYQPSTSFQMTSAMITQRRSNKIEAEENDYDVVPEYIERDKFYINVDSSIGENYSVVHSMPYSLSEKLPAASATSNSNTTISHDKIQQHAAVSVTAGISSLNLVKKSPSSHQVYGSNTSSGSRHSSGIHVTPSPSDSGIVDYETIIRDKENELTNVRATMEQNEEVVVKVYLEKERLWKEQLADLKQKLQASQQGENALRQQIQRCNEEREQFRSTIQNLTSDKQGLQRKCLQLEREFFQLRECFDELIRNRDETVCGPCRKRITCYITAANTNNSIADKRVRPPLPAPRYSKESSSERELRNEVDELRGEVSTLRDTLNEQIGLFADERKRWEEERIKILKSSNSPSDRLGLLSMNDSSSVEMTSQLSRDLKILTDGKSYIVSHDRLI
uniref:Bm3820 n=2 Tax=Brugia malayi TaxID=6279 RepID=A0A5S6PLI5_BRUMA